MKQNPKIKSLRASIEKIDKKIAELKEKRKGLQEELQKLENMDTADVFSSGLDCIFKVGQSLSVWNLQ